MSCNCNCHGMGVKYYKNMEQGIICCKCTISSSSLGVAPIPNCNPSVTRGNDSMDEEIIERLEKLEKNSKYGWLLDRIEFLEKEVFPLSYNVPANLIHTLKKLEEEIKNINNNIKLYEHWLCVLDEKIKKLEGNKMLNAQGKLMNSLEEDIAKQALELAEQLLLALTNLEAPEVALVQYALDSLRKLFG